MKRFVLILSFLFVSLSPALPAEVLMVKWMENNEVDNIFEENLKKLHPNVKFRQIVANRDKISLAKSLKTFDFSNISLVYSFGTTTTKIVKSHLRGEKPLIFNFVSAPVLSGIADSLEKPGNNLTGASMLVNLQTQFELLKKIKDIKKLGVWFDPREQQSQIIMKELAGISKDLGFELVPVRIIPDADQFERMLEQALGETKDLDALYIIASVSIFQVERKLYEKLPSDLLVMSSLIESVRNGSTLAFTNNLRKQSAELAQVANRILEGAPAGDIPVTRVTNKDTVLFINRDKQKILNPANVEKLGIPVELLP